MMIQLSSLVLIFITVFGASNAQYILEVEILTYYNNWDIRFPCTGRNACGAQYAYCLREFGSKSANFLSEKELCLDGHRDSPLGVVPEENATNITLNVREVFVVNSSLPDQIQFFFEATINEENFGTLPMESISVDLNVVASSNYTEILTAATDETFPPVGVLQTRIRASCMQNYFGKNCSTFCAPRDDDSLGHFSCDAEGRVTCLPGYCGPETSCVEECNECESEPCLNGGTCTDLFNDFSCDCSESFNGSFCEIVLSKGGSDTNANGLALPPHIIGIIAGSAGGTLLLLLLLMVLCLLCVQWRRKLRKFPLKPCEIDPKKFAPVEIFHDITVMKENISYHTNGNSRLPLENQDSYVSMNPVDLEQHVYESISDTEDVVHSSTNSKNYILSTSRETTI